MFDHIRQDSFLIHTTNPDQKTFLQTGGKNPMGLLFLQHSKNLFYLFFPDLQTRCDLLRRNQKISIFFQRLYAEIHNFPFRLPDLFPVKLHIYQLLDRFLMIFDLIQLIFPTVFPFGTIIEPFLFLISNWSCLIKTTGLFLYSKQNLYELYKASTAALSWAIAFSRVARGQATFSRI